jgi:hypothetical protein
VVSISYCVRFVTARLLGQISMFLVVMARISAKGIQNQLKVRDKHGNMAIAGLLIVYEAAISQ